MNIITDSITREREYSGILSALTEQARLKKRLPMLVTGLCDGARTALFISLAVEYRKRYGHGCPILVPDEKDALRLSNAFAECGLMALTYPLRDFVFHNITASHEYEHERLSVLSAIINDAYDAVITTPDAALQFTMPREILEASTKRIKSTDTVELDALTAFLTSSGYVRVEMVDGTGQFSVRGGIVDIYPPQSPNPVRIDLFGDEIEQMGVFDVMTQRRIENITGVDITPAREVVISPECRTEIKKAVMTQLKKATDDRDRDMFAAELEEIAAGGELRFSDKYLSLIYPQKICLLDYFTEAPLIIAQDYNALADRIKSFEWHQKQAITSLLENASVAPKYAEYCKWGVDFEMFIETTPTLICDMFASGASNKRLCGIFSMLTKQTTGYSDNYELLREDIKNYRASNYSLALTCENEAIAKTMQSMLNDDEIPAVLSDGEKSSAGAVNIVYGMNLSGFELTVTHFACLSTYANPNSLSRTLKTQKKTGKSKKSSREKIMSYADLEAGDYIVHQNHGIGQYLGLESLTVNGVTRDFMKIKYAGTDMLYLPVSQLDMVSKYIGARGDDGLVKLSKMGGAEWVKAKSKAKGAAKEMAKELIKLYAERMKREGYAFPSDDDLQREFEAAFEYEETDGQLEAIGEIKRDMESPVPMDRLLCGDVGFGKTEVALRAAFKAVDAGKQVAILVPTTILAMQHYQTLLSRMRGFAIKIDMLSRFRAPKQQAETIRKLRRGDIDIIVGTHRIVSSDVVFRDLGLVVVDEEQRFGVAQKEKLKQIAYNVDSLTLTATPIPRTLNMAMSGIRDMSVLEEAPGDRLPVQTYVLEYDDLIIAEALKKELRRGGQVFYLHNRVESIYQTAAHLQAMVPDARIAVGHGQMDKEELSDIWRSLVIGEVDVLVSTTIIETGVDVPNANTLIIEDADKMGLSQLHQIRGRVGRSSRRAFAYFTYPKGKVLSEIATKRLGAIRDYTEFGSGFKVALRDMEIRGAGNLLGAQQHGHIESIGYDLYMKILNEAILEEKGELAVKKTECTVDLKYSAFIPDTYIRSSTQRIDAYKKIASIENEEDLRDITDELLDRWGDMPKTVLALLNISLIRGLGSEANISGVSSDGGLLTLTPAHMRAELWTSMAALPDYKGRLLMNVGAKPYVSIRLKKDENAIDAAKDALNKYIKIMSARDGGDKRETEKSK